MNFTFKDVVENGVLVVFFVIVANLVISYFNNLIQNKKKSDASTQEREDKIFNMFAEMIKENTASKNETIRLIAETNKSITEMKQLILNNTNMNISDFELFIKLYYKLICLELEQEVNKIIFDNHIVEGTRILTNRKMENLLEVKITDFNYTIAQLNFDKNMTNEVIDFNKFEKQHIKNMFVEAVSLYIATEEKQNKQETTYRFLHEGMKSVFNAFVTNLYSITNNTIN